MKKFNRETGQTLIFAAITMTVLLGFVAFATDIGVMLHMRRETQTGADSAALAGATEALAEGSPTSISQGMWNAIAGDAALNGVILPAGTPSGTSYCQTSTDTFTKVCAYIGSSVTVPAFQVSSSSTADPYVEVQISHVTSGVFGGVANQSSMTVGSTAVASDIITSNGCVYVTNPGWPSAGANPAVYMSGNSLILAPTCGISINGNLTFNGGKASIDAGFVAVAGTISNTSSIDGGYAANIPPQTNPMASLNLTANQPTAGTTAGGACGSVPSGTSLGCIYDLGGGNLTAANLATLGYCPGGVCALPSGILYFDVPVTVSGAINSGANGTVFYIANGVQFDFDANGTLTMSPPLSSKTDTFYNILIDDPSAPAGGMYSTCKAGKGNNGNPGELYFDFGSSNTTLNGIVYAPDAQLFEQDSGATMSINTDLVIGNICQQSATFSVNGLTNDSPITKVGLVY